jgi:hypothetical protein
VLNLYKDVHFHGEGLVVSVIAFVLLLIVEQAGAKKDTRQWNSFRVVAPALVWIVASFFLPCIDPAPDDMAFLNAVVVTFGWTLALESVRKGKGLCRGYAIFMLCLYSLFALLIMAQFLAILLE